MFGKFFKKKKGPWRCLFLHVFSCAKIYEYTMMYQSNIKNFIMFIIVLGQQVSILIESPSGPSKIQILT